MGGTMIPPRVLALAATLLVSPLAVWPGGAAERRATPMVGRAPPAAIRAVPVALGLAFPAGFTFSPDGRIWYGERYTGEIRILDPGTGSDVLFATVPDLATDGEQGLLGLAIHPGYPATPLVYAFATRQPALVKANQIIRVRDVGGTARSPRIVYRSDAPLADRHQGGRILFGPDGKLYAIEGNHVSSENSQDLTNGAGKIHRLGADGSIPPDNPLPGSSIYAYGIRNSFGFAFDPQSGRLWETEPANFCNDEINLVVGGGNYGWGPTQTCRTPPPPPQNTNQDGPDPILPVEWFTPVITPVGVAFCEGCGLSGSEGTMFFSAWNLGQIRRAVLSPDRLDIASMSTVYQHTRPINSMEVGPDGALYFGDDQGIYRLVEV